MTLLILLLIVTALLVAERYETNHRVRSIRYRIHVNGTRGKSSVTRFIASGLRASGLRTMGKVTGILPAIILENGTDRLVQRHAPPRVHEQLSIIRKASREKADALVLECMSISPEYQRIETQIFQPQYYIITNIRDDHREEMGTTIEGQAAAICTAIPFNSTVITAEREFLPLIKKISQERNTLVIEILPSDDFMKTNRAIAENVCRAIDNGCLSAGNAIRLESENAEPRQCAVAINGCNVRFLNGLAVNDVPSAEKFLEKYFAWNLSGEKKIILLNTRSDRPLRTAEFCRWLGTKGFLDGVIVTGTHSPYAFRKLKRLLPAEVQLTQWNGRETAGFESLLCSIIHEPTVIVGFGNIGGVGIILSQYFLKKEMDDH